MSPGVSEFSDDDLAAWIRSHPETWHYAYSEADPPLDADQMDEIVTSVLSRVGVGDHRGRRWKRRAVVGGLSIGLVVGGAVGVAALVGSGQPTQPTQGIACRSEADPGSDAIVISPSSDPVGACAERWAAGDLGSSDEMPTLTVCIAPSGVVEVYPGPADVCSRIGLASADPDLSPENEAVVTLQDRLVEEVNLAECAPAADVLIVAQAMLGESGLKGWNVEVRDDSITAVCAKAVVDTTTKTITVIKFP